jgi:hypothetical protein
MCGSYRVKEWVTRTSSELPLVFVVDLYDRLGATAESSESWTKVMSRDREGASLRMKARRIGIDAAMMAVAGSAVPKTLMSTVVAFCNVSDSTSDDELETGCEECQTYNY